MWRLALLLALTALSGRAVAEQDRASDFDFYVLALSWSPSYCASVEPGRSPLQCDSGQSFAFVLHGLWPQYESGYPADCSSEERCPSAALVASLLDIMPSEGLVHHQWRKHGSCSGLSAEDYFALARAAFDSLSIPEAYSAPSNPLILSSWSLEAEFLADNPALADDAFSLVCRGSVLREIRVCLDQDLQPRACAELEERDCRRRSLTLPPVQNWLGAENIRRP